MSQIFNNLVTIDIKYFIKHRLIIWLTMIFIIESLFISCIDKNISNISESLVINSSYSLPIGDVSYDINDYFELLKDLGLDTLLPDTVQIDTIQSQYGDSLGLVEYNDTLYENIKYVVDTLIYKEFNFSSLGDDLEKIKAVTFVSIINNDFPTETHMQVYLADESTAIIDSLFSSGPYFFSPPELDGDGIPVDRPLDIVTTPVSEYIIENLAEVRYIIVYGYVKTLRPDIDISKFYSYYILSIHIAVRIELEFNTSEF